MSDAELRRLERAWQESGSAEDERRLLRAQRRQGADDVGLVERLYTLTPAGDPERGPLAAALLDRVPELTALEFRGTGPAAARRLAEVVVQGPPGVLGLPGWSVAAGRPCWASPCDYRWGDTLAEEVVRGRLALAEGLEHPNLARLVAWGRQPEPHLVIDWGEASEPLPLGAPVPLPDAVAWAEDVARGVAAGHAVGLIHGELTPDAIRLTAAGRAVVEPFGRRCLRQAHAIPDYPVPMPMVLPWPDYLSPAMVEGRAATPACDVFLIGALLAHLLTGRSQFRREQTVPTLAAILFERPPPLRTQLPDAPPALEAVLERALSRLEEDRYPTAGALADALALARSTPAPLPSVHPVPPPSSLAPEPMPTPPPDVTFFERVRRLFRR